MAVISVVIPVLNDAPLLAVCLGALARQRRRADEIIVVDDGCTDDSVAVALGAGARVVRSASHGIPAATAAGLDAAAGDILARLDADSVPPPDWLARIEAAFDRDPGLAAVTGPGDFYGASALVHWLGRRLYIGGYFWSMGALLGHPPLFGSNFALRATAWTRLRTSIHRGNPAIHDDLDLSFQIAPDMRVLLDRDLRVGLSARPFTSPNGLRRRLRWAWTTIDLNLRERSWPERRRTAAAGRRQSRRGVRP